MLRGEVDVLSDSSMQRPVQELLEVPKTMDVLLEEAIVALSSLMYPCPVEH